MQTCRRAVYLAEGSSKRAPHHSVYDRVDARVEAAEDGQPAQKVAGENRIQREVGDVEEDEGDLERQPAQCEDGRNRQACHHQSNCLHVGRRGRSCWSTAASSRHYLNAQTNQKT